MGVFHFLNVKQGDCSIIQHLSGNVTVIDVCNASKEIETPEQRFYKALQSAIAENKGGNFRQKEEPVNPIEYLRNFGISSIFRFIVTHPDMDHIGGIKDFFEAFSPLNIWDTANTAEKDFNAGGGPHDEEDWNFYRQLRDSDPDTSPRRLTLYAGAREKFFNVGSDGSNGGDGLHVLAPTRELIEEANRTGDYNDASYVILYRSNGGRILLAGDSHDKTWEHVLRNHAADVKDVELLVAPHHGRKSGRLYDFLDVVNPCVTFFGNANSEHLAYSAWYSRDLFYVTNNQANCMIVDTNTKPMTLYVTNEAFAKTLDINAPYDPTFRAYRCGQFAR